MPGFYTIYRTIKGFVSDIYYKRHVIYELAKRQLLSQNQEKYFGAFWAYFEPVTFILILWFVFGVGLRVNPGNDIPFIVYLVSGMTAWSFFAENIGKLTGVLEQHAYLVTKVNFRLSILPIAILLSKLIPHLVLLGVTIIIGMFYDIYPSFYALQVGYYLFALLLFLLGLGWLTSSVTLFVQDIPNIIGIIVRLGFFLTPIFWNIEKVPKLFQQIMQFNPMCYIVIGYRDSLIYHVPFWSKPYQTLYFWGFTVFVIVAGAIVFKRLRPHFAEVL